MIRTEVGELYLMVAPFWVSAASPLYSITDVFNGVLVHGNFVDDVLFFGRGAGAAPTASAMVGDIMHIAMGGHRIHRVWEAAKVGDVTDFAHFACRRYVALSGVDHNAVTVLFGDAEFLPMDGGIAFLTGNLSEKELSDKLARAEATGAVLLSHIRIY